MAGQRLDKFGNRMYSQGKYAAVIHCSMIRNHPSLNMDERSAITTLLVFLSLDGKLIQAGIYNFAAWAASGPPQVVEQTVDATRGSIDKNLIILSISYM